MAKDELVSMREFARQLKTTLTTVRKAIAAGKIKAIDHTNPKRPKIYLKQGRKEWAKSFTPEKIQNQKLANELAGRNETPVETDEENKDASDVTDATELRIGNQIEYQEAVRIEKIYKAKTAQVEYNEKRGRLVEKDSVYREYYAIAQSARSALQGVADKITDHLMAECNIAPEHRPTVHGIIYKEITESLEMLSLKPQLK